MTERTLTCPICDRDLFIEAHISGEKYTNAQLWVIRKLDKLGLSDKVIGRVTGSSGRSIQRALQDARKRGIAA